VQGLIDQNTSTWNAPLINSIFFEEAASRSLHVWIVRSHDKDNLIWETSQQGHCTTKEAYKILSAQIVHLNSNLGPRSLKNNFQILLRSIWKHKHLPPRIKTFA
jgi:hypothetical protein